MRKRGQSRFGEGSPAERGGQMTGQVQIVGEERGGKVPLLGADLNKKEYEDDEKAEDVP